MEKTYKYTGVHSDNTTLTFQLPWDLTRLWQHCNGRYPSWVIAERADGPEFLLCLSQFTHILPQSENQAEEPANAE